MEQPLLQALPPTRLARVDEYFVRLYGLVGMIGAAAEAESQVGLDCCGLDLLEVISVRRAVDGDGRRCLTGRHLAGGEGGKRSAGRRYGGGGECCRGTGGLGALEEEGEGSGAS